MKSRIIQLRSMPIPKGRDKSSGRCDSVDTGEARDCFRVPEFQQRSQCSGPLPPGAARRTLPARPEGAYWRLNTTYRIYAIAVAASLLRRIEPRSSRSTSSRLPPGVLQPKLDSTDSSFSSTNSDHECTRSFLRLDDVSVGIGRLLDLYALVGAGAFSVGRRARLSHVFDRGCRPRDG